MCRTQYIDLQVQTTRAISGVYLSGKQNVVDVMCYSRSCISTRLAYNSPCTHSRRETVSRRCTIICVTSISLKSRSHSTRLQRCTNYARIAATLQWGGIGMGSQGEMQVAVYNTHPRARTQSIRFLPRHQFNNQRRQVHGSLIGRRFVIFICYLCASPKHRGLYQQRYRYKCQLTQVLDIVLERPTFEAT